MICVFKKKMNIFEEMVHLHIMSVFSINFVFNKRNEWRLFMLYRNKWNKYNPFFSLLKLFVVLFYFFYYYFNIKTFLFSYLFILFYFFFKKLLYVCFIEGFTFIIIIICILKIRNSSSNILFYRNLLISNETAVKKYWQVGVIWPCNLLKKKTRSM